VLVRAEEPPHKESATMTPSNTGLTGRVLVALAFILCLPNVLWGLTGNNWKELPDTAKQSYVAGVYDAFMTIYHSDTEILKTESNPSLSKVVKCVREKRMPYAQIMSIVDKYFRDHPENWNYDMAGLIWGALLSACKEP
jgi:hypothetical protein